MSCHVLGVTVMIMVLLFQKRVAHCERTIVTKHLCDDRSLIIIIIIIIIPNNNNNGHFFCANL